MTTTPASLGAITLFVADPQRSKAFYGRVFDRQPVYEDGNAVAFGFENTVINLLKLPEAHGLIAPARVADPAAGASFQLTIWVDDTDAACAELSSLGVELLNGPIDRVWGMRTAAFTDPDGHIWEVAQNIKG